VSRSSAGGTMVAFVGLAIIGFATTWGPLPWVVCAEIYPLRYKARAMAMATASNWTWNFLIGFFTPFISNTIGYALGYIFGAVTLSMFAFAYFFVPETSGKSLEEIDAMILSGVKPWKSAQWRASDQETGSN
jgi:MFS transporter, SP family, sugar:H+ symporter